jgi:type VI protein secretion system component VasA
MEAGVLVFGDGFAQEGIALLRSVALEAAAVGEFIHALVPGLDGGVTVRREPRVWSERQRQHGPRTAFVGTECFLSLVDAQQAPHAADLRQLSVTAWVTNRDLPVLLPGAGQTAVAADGGGGRRRSAPVPQ